MEAAARNDPGAMWGDLSAASRRRLGPTLARFRTGVAHEFQEDPGSYARGRYAVVLSQRVTTSLAVAAIGGTRTVDRKAEHGTYAAAFRFERGAWRLELRGPVRIEADRPDPGEVVRRRTQLAADVAAHAAIVEAGMWFDGRAFPARGYSTNPRYLGMWGEAPQPLRPGHHTVVAFAAAGGTATALGWTFLVR